MSRFLAVLLRISSFNLYLCVSSVAGGLISLGRVSLLNPGKKKPQKGLVSAAKIMRLNTHALSDGRKRRKFRSFPKTLFSYDRMSPHQGV